MELLHRSRGLLEFGGHKTLSDYYKGEFFSSSAFLTLEELVRTSKRLMSDNLSDRKTICEQVTEFLIPD